MVNQPPPRVLSSMPGPAATVLGQEQRQRMMPWRRAVLGGLLRRRHFVGGGRGVADGIWVGISVGRSVGMTVTTTVCTITAAVCVGWITSSVGVLRRCNRRSCTGGQDKDEKKNNKSSHIVLLFYIKIL